CQPKKRNQNHENSYYHRSESAWTHLRRVRPERVPSIHPPAAAARFGRRFHEGAVHEPLLLRCGGAANRWRSALVGRTLCCTRTDAAWSGDREHIVVSHLA